MTTTAAIKDFFGMDNRTAISEIRALTPAEKGWFALELTKVGYEISEHQAVAA